MAQEQADVSAGRTYRLDTATHGAPTNGTTEPDFVLSPHTSSGAQPPLSIEPLICPHCQGRLMFIRTLTPRQAMGP